MKIFEHIPDLWQVGILYDIGCQGDCCRWDIGSLYDPPPGPRSKGPSIDLNNPV